MKLNKLLFLLLFFSLKIFAAGDEDKSSSVSKKVDLSKFSTEDLLKEVFSRDIFDEQLRKILEEKFPVKRKESPKDLQASHKEQPAKKSKAADETEEKKQESPIGDPQMPKPDFEVLPVRENPLPPKKGAFQGLTPHSKAHGKQTNVIYVQHAQGVEGEKISFFIEPKDRIDLAKIMKGLNIEEITPENLPQVFLKVEEHLAKLAENGSLTVEKSRTTVYTGETSRTLTERAGEHGREINRTLAPTNKKTSSSHEIMTAGYNIFMSSLINNVPQPYLKHFEVLMTKIFHTLGIGGTSAVAGNRDAWEAVKAYWKSQERQQKILDNYPKYKEYLENKAPDAARKLFGN